MLHTDGPADADDIRHFIAWLSVHNYAASTISTYVAAIGYYHKLHGFDDPTGEFLVSKLLEGCRRNRPSFDGREPMSVTLLDTIIRSLPAVCASSFECSMYSAAFSLAFFGFLRLGEFAADSRNRISESVLRASDVAMEYVDGQPVSVCIRLRQAKNNQCGPPSGCPRFTFP